MKLYVTYGGGTYQRNNFSIVDGDDWLDCRMQIEETIGKKFSMTYEEKEFLPQIEMHGLTEIPLQQHVYERSE
jgi:hypothetical protein